uniref:helix-turn-helix domain-containing protein n=1 Tax=Rhodoferax sp. GW822-FHT02A01 TaxID=3141537 RepID=UPI00406D0975
MGQGSHPALGCALGKGHGGKRASSVRAPLPQRFDVVPSRALRENAQGSIPEVAALLGISRATTYRILLHGISHAVRHRPLGMIFPGCGRNGSR